GVRPVRGRAGSGRESGSSSGSRGVTDPRPQWCGYWRNAARDVHCEPPPAGSLLVPLAVVEAAVVVVEPRRRRRLTLLADRVHRAPPDPLRPPPDLLPHRRPPRRLLGQPHHLPGASEPVDVVAGDALLAGRVPPQFRHLRVLATQDVPRLRRDRQGVRRRPAL